LEVKLDHNTRETIRGRRAAEANNREEKSPEVQK
jgi:hypothetical protein